MGGRVLATEDGQQAISGIQTILGNGLTGNIQGIIQHGNRLSEPGVWDGGNAGKFRADWPTIQSSLNSVLKQLEQLQNDLQLAHTAIMHAGGNATQ